MNCVEFDRALDDYLDGELDAGMQAEVESHLEECKACQQATAALRSMQERASRLPVDVAPPRDLWPTIASRLHPSAGQRPMWWLQLAAAAVILAVLSIPLTVWWAGRQTEVASSDPEVVLDGRSLSVQAAVARSEDGVLLPRTDLVTAVERHRSLVEQGTLGVFEENMELLDRAIGEIHQALEEDPQNLRLRMLLAARYQQERKLLQKVSRV